MTIKSIGFPRMHKDAGEKRDFLPDFFEFFKNFPDRAVSLEEGYGSAMGFTKEDYLRANPDIRFVGREDAYKTDLVIVLRSPEFFEIDWMKPGAALLSMLHFDTRNFRNDYLMKKGVYCYSMDSVKNDEGVRMVVNYYGTAYSGASVAFQTLKESRPDFYDPARNPLVVSIMGFGAIGLNAAKAFKNLSNQEFLKKKEKLPGLIIRMLTRSITEDGQQMEKTLPDTDILVDATWRRDASKIIIPNRMLGRLPEHAVILDLTADPYDTKITPMQVKAIEGIPTGSLSRPVIQPGDDDYKKIPPNIDQTHKRTVVSCNAWPGVYPKDAMSVYGRQLRPFVRILLEKGTALDHSERASLHERALKKASLEYFETFGMA